MGVLEEMDAMSAKGQPQCPVTGDGSTCLAAQIKASPCQQGDDSDYAEIRGSQVQLPEDILRHIHTFMQMQDVAQAACVYRSFLRSWSCYPKLMLSVDSLRIKEDASRKDEISREFISRVDHILQNHSGMGVKMFSLHTYPCSDLHPSYVDRWLQIAITPGIENFELTMFGRRDIKYNFPCSVLSSERRSSIQSFLLGQFYLSNCRDIICLKIPYLLKQLNILHVFCCLKLEMIESNAPKLSIFYYAGDPICTSVGDALHVRRVDFRHDHSPGALYYARTKLPLIVPNVRTLVLSTRAEVSLILPKHFITGNTPMASCKFLQLKYLEIVLCALIFPSDYDFYSLVSFLDASPALETFVLRIAMPTIRPDSIIEDSGGDFSRPRCLSEQCHGRLKNVMITGFCSAKSMIELTIHIIGKTMSLVSLTLDTTRGHDRRCSRSDKCLQLSKDALVEAEKARVAIQRYVEGRVPSSVNQKVIEPCSKCIY
uniref:At1g61320/AtMIF1 LRR domain-containing protein n=1 Tax=Setaria italica TaxID=4555 RepID=K3ZI88_SETIT